MINYYIFIKSDSFSKDGRPLSAYDATIKLMNSNVWPLYKKTANRKHIKEGDKILFYVSGKKKDAQVFLGSAVITKITDWKKKHDLMSLIFSNNPPYTEVKFELIETFNPPVKIRNFLDKMTFLPKSKKHWGTAFIGGVKKIDQYNYEILSGIKDQSDINIHHSN